MLQNATETGKYKVHIVLCNYNKFSLAASNIPGQKGQKEQSHHPSISIHTHPLIHFLPFNNNFTFFLPPPPGFNITTTVINLFILRFFLSPPPQLPVVAFFLTLESFLFPTTPSPSAICTSSPELIIIHLFILLFT